MPNHQPDATIIVTYLIDGGTIACQLVNPPRCFTIMTVSRPMPVRSNKPLPPRLLPRTRAANNNQPISVAKLAICAESKAPRD